MREEIIDYLIRNEIDVTEESIASIIKSGMLIKVDDTLMAEESVDRNLLSKIFTYVSSLVSESSHSRNKLASEIDVVRQRINDRIDRLNRNIETGLNEIKAAQVLEKNMSGYVNTISLDFSNKTLFDKSETTATISDDMIIGTVASSKLKSDKTAIRIVPYLAGSAIASMVSDGNIYPARVEKINSGGIGYTPLKTEVLINDDSSFQIVAESEDSAYKRLDLIIDKMDSEYFNQIEINLQKAHLATIYTSDDGKTYSKVYSKPRYIKNSVIPIPGTRSRFIKISFEKNKSDFSSGGKNSYRVRFVSLSILSASIEDIAVVETNDIPIDGTYSVMCLSTCCNYSDKNIFMDYKISIDRQEWQSIRPVAKIGSNNAHPIVLPLNDYSDNKLISLKEYQKIGDSYRYGLSIPSDFINSNKIRVFSGDIIAGGYEWKKEDGYYVAFGIVDGPIKISLGATSMEINGKWTTGDASIDRGVYKIRVADLNYANVLNYRNATVLSSANGEYVVVDSLGITRTAIDPLFPYNHKLIVESLFSSLFYDELIEKDDYTLYNNDTGFNITTSIPHDEIIITYRLYQEKLSNIRLRVEMKSLDKNTIPYIEKAFIRLA
jgi:hypothetical protein